MHLHLIEVYLHVIMAWTFGLIMGTPPTYVVHETLLNYKNNYFSPTMSIYVKNGGFSLRMYVSSLCLSESDEELGSILVIE